MIFRIAASGERLESTVNKNAIQTVRISRFDRPKETR